MTHSFFARLGVAAVLLALLVPAASFAASFKAGEQPSLPAGETIADDLYMTGGSVASMGSVRGDLAAAGGNVLVSGSTLTDLTAAGGSVTILGNVGDDLRAAGGNILVQGRVGDDAFVGGGQVVIGGPGIGGDLFIGGGVVRLDAPVEGMLRAGGGEVYINAPIGGDAKIYADSVTLGPQARIAGNLSYTSKKEVVMEEGAKVLGTTEFTQAKKTRGVGAKGIAALIVLGLISGFLMLIAGALAVAYLLRRYAEALVETATAQPLLEIGRGFVFLVAAPAASILLLFTVIGIPLGILGLIAFAGISVFTFITVPIVLGSIVHKWLFRAGDYRVSWKTVLLGVVALLLLKLIPIVGWVASFVVLLLTMGASVHIQQNALKEWR